LRVTGIITHISDHNAQLLEILNVKKCEIKKVVKRRCRKFTDNNLSMFLKDLCEETWLEVFQSPVDKKYDVFISI
jgi:predicted XRE-type DNA-binding protein